MPTYQYKCTACGHRLDAVQSFSDAPLTECPNCQGELRKLFSSVGVVFKGSGFYRTDSRSGSSSSEPAKSTADSSSSSTKSDSSSSSSSSGGSGSSGSSGSSGTSGSSGSSGSSSTKAAV
ncbi:FmdB family zinc ribbon protein [Cryptosporangium phraense]|uniref:FmdB family transcriptional regulator n=1 Tax=Cryptosporangium phraense TaxID=2593070 RepID=A0A545AW53_9ACTN|nr:FmdB family transcriptional regulator [Cryptosporangium phraense]